MARVPNPRRDQAQPFGPPGDVRSQILNMILMGDMPNPMGPNDPDPYNENPNVPPVMQYEDDPQSYWDARHMGNKKGSSYINGVDESDEDYYLADPTGNGPRMDVIQALLASMGVK